VADAGPDQTVITGETVQLDGSGSSAPEGDPLTFEWTIASSPGGSAAVLDDPTLLNPVFVPDVAGSYEVQLVVNDGSADSSPDHVSIIAKTPQQATLDVANLVADLVAEGVLNGGEGNSLTSTLDAAIRKLDQGNTNAAQGQLGAFINKVNAKIKAGRLTEEEGQALIDAVSEIIAHLAGGAAKMVALPEDYGLSQSYPNPANPAAQIAYQLPEAGDVRLTVYNLLGQPVRVLVQSYHEAGSYRVEWDGRNEYRQPVSSGVYFYRLESRDFSLARRMLLLR